jgi:hypothetical protein
MRGVALRVHAVIEGVVSRLDILCGRFFLGRQRFGEMWGKSCGLARKDEDDLASILPATIPAIEMPSFAHLFAFN